MAALILTLRIIQPPDWGLNLPPRAGVAWI